MRRRATGPADRRCQPSNSLLQLPQIDLAAGQQRYLSGGARREPSRDLVRRQFGLESLAQRGLVERRRVQRDDGGDHLTALRIRDADT